MNPVLQIQDLDADGIADVLRRNRVGRLAYRLGEGVDIEPVHYTFTEGAIFGRTSPGTKLMALDANHRVAFEVDEIDGDYEWRSVVVRGSFHRIPRFGTGDGGERFRRALETLRSTEPAALTRDDAAPHRTVLFRIPVVTATGRAGRLRD